jgi:glycosyltransferase involved in cell wall biosynthesis
MIIDLFFIQEHLERTTFHGGIGNIDAEKIFLQKGFKPIYFPCHYDFSFRAKIVRAWYLIKIFSGLPKDCCVAFQFPLYARMNKLLVKLLTRRKSIRIICLIADINGLKSGDDALLRREIKELGQFRYFIVHNEAMKQWLLSKTTVTRFGCIDFFDFLTPPVVRIRRKSPEIVFAGNLEKSAFLSELGKLQKTSPEVVFNIYGKDPPAIILRQPNINYKGIANPYSLPEKIEGAFGLVWDGDSIEGSGGSLGSYMKYISHHKLSLYILCGLPIITASWAASARLVARYKIGITVNSLYELENAIRNIGENEYLQMTENTKALAPQIANGKMLGSAIDDLLKN